MEEKKKTILSKSMIISGLGEPPSFKNLLTITPIFCFPYLHSNFAEKAKTKFLSVFSNMVTVTSDNE